MRKVIKYCLNHETTLNYFKNYFTKRNELSKSILNFIDFNKGHFYTLLPEDADISKLYQFEFGKILPSNPTEKIHINKLGTFQGEWVNSIDEELVEWIYDKLQYKKLACLMENLIQEPTDPHMDLYRSIGIHYNKEVFYLISQNDFAKELIKKALNECSCAWHFVSVIFDLNKLNFNNKQITQKDFINVCANTLIIIIGAYDGEGYVFWEKQNK